MVSGFVGVVGPDVPGTALLDGVGAATHSAEREEGMGWGIPR